MDEFVTWARLGTYGGTLTMVILMTQFYKSMLPSKKIPIQLVTYVITLLVMFPTLVFTDQLSLNSSILVFFNAIVISIASNGGYNALVKLTGRESYDGKLSIDKSSNADEHVYQFDFMSLNDLKAKQVIKLLVDDEVDLSAIENPTLLTDRDEVDQNGSEMD